MGRTVKAKKTSDNNQTNTEKVEKNQTTPKNQDSEKESVHQLPAEENMVNGNDEVKITKKATKSAKGKKESKNESKKSEPKTKATKKAETKDVQSNDVSEKETPIEQESKKRATKKKADDKVEEETSGKKRNIKEPVNEKDKSEKHESVGKKETPKKRGRKEQSNVEEPKNDQLEPNKKRSKKDEDVSPSAEVESKKTVRGNRKAPEEVPIVKEKVEEKRGKGKSVKKQVEAEPEPEKSTSKKSKKNEEKVEAVEKTKALPKKASNNKAAKQESGISKAPSKPARGKSSKKETIPEPEDEIVEEPKEEKENGTSEAPKKSVRGKTGKKNTEPEENAITVEEPKKEKGKKKEPKAAETSQKVTSKGKAGEKKEKSKDEKKFMNSVESDLSIDFGISSEYNMKVVMWNTSGLRSCVEKGCTDYLKHENADIICLNEIKCGTEEEIPEKMKLDGYHAYWNIGKGQPGVGILSKSMPIEVFYDLPGQFSDEKRLLTAEFRHFYLVCCYVVNAGRGLKTLEKRLEWNQVFDDYVKELDKKKPVIIAGDMNVAHTEIDLANPKTNQKNAGFTKEEREGFTTLLSYGFIDTFRNFYPDQKGAYTFWSYMNNARVKNVGWRLDYFITSERFMGKVKDNVIRSTVKGSDHCPIVLFLNV